MSSLFKHALITPLGDDWFVTAEGYDAPGLPRRAPITLDALDTVITQAEMAQHGASQVLLDEIDEQDPTDAEIEASYTIDPEIEALVTATEARARAEAKDAAHAREQQAGAGHRDAQAPRGRDDRAEVLKR